METQTQDRFMDTGGGQEGEGGCKGVRMEYKLSYVKQIANGNLLQDSGNSNWGSVTRQRAGIGKEVKGILKREGRQLIHVDVWQKTTQYCKAIIFQLKINTFNLKYHFIKSPGERCLSEYVIQMP